MSVLVIVQARMGASRFPGKVLAPLRGKPVVRWVVDACRETPYSLVVALPDDEANDPLIAYLEASGIHYTYGSESDVLGRYARAAQQHPEADIIVRVTADCPLIDHRTITEMVERRSVVGAVYYGRTNDPDGNDVEVFTRDFLMESDRRAGANEREHVTTWMRRQSGATMAASGHDHWDVKYSVDTVEDLAVCGRLLDIAGEGATWDHYVAAYRSLKVTA